MYIGIDVAIHLADGINDALWLLRGGGVVEIYQRAMIDLTLEDGKVLSVHIYIKERARARVRVRGIEEKGARRGEKGARSGGKGGCAVITGRGNSRGRLLARRGSDAL